ncbi:MAG: translation initiation factor IF-3 [Candidatus Omnitrophota bacterium]
MNERIFAKTVRLIGPEGEQLGVFSKEIALRKSQEYELDLVEVAPGANPSVCRIMDFAKYKYEQEKKEREAKKHQKHSQLKEIRISPRIDPHDYVVKLKHIQEFLEKGHKVKVRLFFKGREFYHQEAGKRILDKLIADLESSCGRVEKAPQLFGRSIIIIFGPNSK